MSIDWSKAPKDATHWEPDSYHVFGSWMKKEGDSWFWWEGDVGRWSPSLFISEQRMGTFEARPQESWNGQGLPPVGTVCEACWNSPDEYYQIMVLAQWDGKAIYRWLAGPSVGGLCESFAGILGEHSGPHPKFRPIRTPEQIAADERRKSILHLANLLIDSRGQCNEYSQAEAIFDAGYRRQEEGK
ncbi:hypothetical protein ACOAQ5_29815 [Pseudomonas aeruginosa]